MTLTKVRSLDGMFDMSSEEEMAEVLDKYGWYARKQSSTMFNC